MKEDIDKLIFQLADFSDYYGNVVIIDAAISIIRQLHDENEYLRRSITIVQNAAKALAIAKDEQMRAIIDSKPSMNIMVSSQLIDSERQANAILTAENEALKKRIVELNSSAWKPLVMD